MFTTVHLNSGALCRLSPVLKKTLLAVQTLESDENRMNAVLLCVIVGALISSFSRPTPASFLQAPDPLNVTVGAVAEFFCRADADAVIWTINDIALIQLDDPNISHDVGLVDGVYTRILRIMADVQYNNSRIQCRSFTSGEGETASGPALLMVQGLLSAPTNTQASRPSPSAIHLYWDPPFTLDITNVDPDIPGYIVSITNNNTKVTREKNVTKPEFVFQEEDHDPCHVYLFRVRAWNPVGVGEPSDVIVECFDGAPQSANINLTMRDALAEEQTTLQLTITYDMSCHGRRPESIDINTILDDGTQISVDLHTLPNSGRLDFQLDFSADNVPCSVSVTLRNQFGNTDTDIMFEEDCQLGTTDDVGNESPTSSDDGIPLYAVIVVVGVSLLLISVTSVMIGVICWLKRKMSAAKDQDTMEMKENAAYEVHQLPQIRPQPVQLQPCAAYGVISS